MANNGQIHIAVNVQSRIRTSEVVDWLHKMIDTIVGIPNIGRVVLLRLNQQEISREQADIFNRISPQSVCYQYIPTLRRSKDTLGLWWNLALHNAFNTVPYPDYVMHFPFDVEWTVGNGNTVVTRGVLQEFSDHISDNDLLIGAFVASARVDVATPADKHPKNKIEKLISKKIKESFALNCSRPRSEFFVVKRSFYDEFNLDVSPDEFCNDPTVQLLLYAYLNNKRLAEFQMGRYYVPPEEYDSQKVNRLFQYLLFGIMPWSIL